MRAAYQLSNLTLGKCCTATPEQLDRQKWHPQTKSRTASLLGKAEALQNQTFNNDLRGDPPFRWSSLTHFPSPLQQMSIHSTFRNSAGDEFADPPAAFNLSNSASFSVPVPCMRVEDEVATSAP